MTADMRSAAALVANARMYAVNPDVAALWERLFASIAEDADVPLSVIRHSPPQPLYDLWRRTDVGCAFMCGYPWSIWAEDDGRRPRLLAAPQPSAGRYAGRPRYCTDIVVRDDSRYADVDALRGTRFAYTIEHSQSGWQAPRTFFAGRALAHGGRWFGAAIGPLDTPRAVADAVIEGRVDAGPLDSWWHDLLRRHEPATAAQLRTLASTPMTAIPPLICAAATPATLRERLTAALARVGTRPELRDLRDALLIRGFAHVGLADYEPLAQHARDTDALGYRRL